MLNFSLEVGQFYNNLYILYVIIFKHVDYGRNTI